MRNFSKKPEYKWVFDGIQEDPFGRHKGDVAVFKYEDGGRRIQLPNQYAFTENELREFQAGTNRNISPVPSSLFGEAIRAFEMARQERVVSFPAPALKAG